MSLWLVFVLLVFYIKSSSSFAIPEVTFEAYSPKGLRASIPELDRNLERFVIHFNINKEIVETDPGDYHDDTTKATKGVFSNYFPDIELKIGDQIHYWLYIQYNRLGWRKNQQVWKVTQFNQVPEGNCQISQSSASGRSILCEKSIIFEDTFNSNTVDSIKWSIEKYIPFNGPNFEFVSYQDNVKVLFIKEKKLFIKPKAGVGKSDVQGTLDLRQGCTRTNQEECYAVQEGRYILPPVTSAMLMSTTSFKYGVIEIKAKLPAGDWIYPRICLQDVRNPNRTLYVAYARGNDQLLSADGNNDIGSRLLFAGPVLDPEEPGRSRYLTSKRKETSFTEAVHEYKVIWQPDGISFYVDGEKFGETKTRFTENSARLIVGVGVGGVNDFPEGYLSGKDAKPWVNSEPNQMKQFFRAQNQWYNTWNGDNAALQIEHVRIQAL